MIDHRIDDSEYIALRQENVQHVMNISKYLIATIAAYAAVLFWALTNHTKFYNEMLAVILLSIIVISLSMILDSLNAAYKISSYIAIFHELKRERIGWHLTNKEFEKYNHATIFGQPGTILGFLAALVIPISLIDKLNNMEKVTGDFQPYFILIIFVVFLILAGLIYLRFLKLFRLSTQSWIKVALTHNLLTEQEIAKLKLFIKLPKGTFSPNSLGSN